MRRTNFLGLCFSVITFALILQGCGGGSSKSKPITPTNSSAATSASANTSSQTSSNPIQTTSLTINGMVVADALAGADIEIIVGTQRFTTKADAQKSYQLELKVNDENLNVPFFAKATGVNSNQWVQLGALFPSVGALKNLAGSDGVLDSNEYFGVNISSFTTAEFALVKENKSEIKTDADRKTALLGISAERQMEVAAMITVFMTHTDFHLPSNTATTLDFAMDSNITVTYVRVLKESNPSLISAATATIRGDAHQTNISSQISEGQYLIESTYFTYILDLNKDGTGRLQTGNAPITKMWIDSDGVKFVDSPITWIKTNQTIKISFENPIAYGKVTSIPNPDPLITNSSVACSQPIDNQQQLCDATLRSISLTLITENEFRKVLNVSVGADVKNQNGVIVYDFATTLYLATMWDRAAFHTVTNKDIEGFEWYTGNYRYVFSANGTASKIDLKSKQEKNIDWKIENNHLVLDAGSTDIWLRYKNESGFFVTQMQRIQSIERLWEVLLHSYMVKRQLVNMSTTDWVGRWTTSQPGALTVSYDVNSNGRWRDGFETESEGSWSVLSQSKQTALSNGFWRMDRDVLAIYNGRYYIQYCSGPDQSEYGHVFCSIEVVTNDSSFTGNSFWESWSRPLFQEINTGHIWDFNQNELFLLKGEYWIKRPYIKVASNKLYDISGGKILELMSSTTQTIDVCEYNIFADCSTGTLYKLERGVEVRLPATTTGGHLYYEHKTDEFNSFGFTLSKVMMVAKNRPVTFNVYPEPGFEISSVNGCGGEVIGYSYYIPALSADCELSASFTPTPIAN